MLDERYGRLREAVGKSVSRESGVGGGKSRVRGRRMLIIAVSPSCRLTTLVVARRFGHCWHGAGEGEARENQLIAKSHQPKAIGH